MCLFDVKVLYKVDKPEDTNQEWLFYIGVYNTFKVCFC